MEEMTASGKLQKTDKNRACKSFRFSALNERAGAACVHHVFEINGNAHPTFEEK